MSTQSDAERKVKVKVKRRAVRPDRIRLDTLLVEKGLAETREKARRMIMAGLVDVAQQPASKPGIAYPRDVDITVRGSLPYVSRGGLKLNAALDKFGIEAAGMVAVDIGASTGGFTDCLLQRGAARVYAIDVGYGQLAWSLRNDRRVVVMERTNIRHVESLPEPADMAVIDVSFISLELVLPVVRKLLRPAGCAVGLIKPQFEAGRNQVGKGGVVKDVAVHRAVLERVSSVAQRHGFRGIGLIVSPIRGPAGNVEFLAGWTVPDQDVEPEDPGSSESLADWIEEALAASCQIGRSCDKGEAQAGTAGD